MLKYKCKKEPNGYYRQKCVNLKCKDCKNITQANLISQTLQETVKVSQLELIKVPYTKIDKNGNFIQKPAIRQKKLKK